jgi:hypothetical protein
MVKLEAIHSFNNAAGVRRQGLDEMQGHGSLLCDESGPETAASTFPAFRRRIQLLLLLVQNYSLTDVSLYPIPRISIVSS